MIGVLLAAAALLLYGWTRLFRSIWKKGLTVTLQFRESAVYAGGRAHLREVIENRKRLPLPVLEVGFRIGKGVVFVDADNTQVSDFVYKRDIFSLLGMECVTREYEMDCRRRGIYRISQVTCSVRSLLYGKTFSREEPPSEDALFVYAARTDIRGVLPVLETLLGERESARRIYEDPFAFAGIRAYTIQDPMKTVNWKASAKSGELMVNTFSSVMAEQISVYLDISDPYIVKSPKLTEESISLAATVSEAVLTRGIELSLEVNAVPEGADGPFRLPPGRGREQLKRIEQFLASDMEALTETPFAETAEEDGSRIPVFISKNATAAMQELLMKKCGPSGSGVWIIPVQQNGGPLPVTQRGGLRIIRKEVP